MVTDAPIPMRTDATILLAQWLSPAFPVGAFAYSSGLEAAVAGGLTVDGLQDWLADFLVHGTGRADAILIRAAAETDDPAEVDETARAFCASRERLLETESIGRAFCLQLTNVWDLSVANLTYPVALGQGLRGLASAAIDVSDGLLADAGHIASASRCCLALDVDAVPVSPTATACPGRATSIRR